MLRDAQAMLYYDYALTFLDEVEYIWSQPRKLSTLFYVFCRYSLIANPLYMISVSTTIIEVLFPNHCSPAYRTELRLVTVSRILPLGLRLSESSIAAAGLGT